MKRRWKEDVKCQLKMSSVSVAKARRPKAASAEPLSAVAFESITYGVMDHPLERGTHFVIGR